jgi:hypothetical protein
MCGLFLFMLVALIFIAFSTVTVNISIHFDIYYLEFVNEYLYFEANTYVIEKGSFITEF